MYILGGIAIYTGTDTEEGTETFSSPCSVHSSNRAGTICMHLALTNLPTYLSHIYIGIEYNR